jgi:ATP-dependent protease ClpP protease subunit
MRFSPSDLFRVTDSGVATIRLMGGVSDESMRWMCNRAEDAVRYYHADRLILELSSPGGSADALRFGLDRFKEWRTQHGVRISTIALTSVASAGAVLLSLAASPGERKAYSTARLLYHDSRLVLPRKSQLTGSQMEMLRSELAGLDEWLLDQLSAYVMDEIIRPSGDPLIRVPAGYDCGTPSPEYREVEIQSREQLREIYGDLLRRDQFVSAQTAAHLRLIDHVMH